MIQETKTINLNKKFAITTETLYTSDIREGSLFTTVHSYNLFGSKCTIFIRSANDKCYDIRTGLRCLLDDATVTVYAIKFIEG